MERNERQIRATMASFKTREAAEGKYIEGYFAVFNKTTQLWPGATESIAPGAFAESLATDDIRALINHETRLVIGRTKPATLTLREDEKGLWGSILINPKDQDAVNAYERVTRGDVDQCSFGFDILEEETEFHEDGSVHWTIKAVKLYEVSVVTFPAYEDTAVSARKKDFAEIQKRKNEVWREKMRRKLGGK